jgi:hypothetical protein
MPRASRGSLLDKMFDPAMMDRAEQAERLERFKAAWAKTLEATDAGDHEVRRRSFEDGSGHYHLVKGAGQKRRVLNWLTSAEGRSAVKAAGAGGLAAGLERDMEGLRGFLEADLRKDWTPSNPISTGIVPYDLEDLIKQLVPRDTPLRNDLMRMRGEGSARRYFRITGWTNSRSGGVASATPFFNSQTVSTSFGSLGLRRPPKISYAGDFNTIPYVELGFSDSVAWIAQFEALGLTDLRALSHTASMWAHLLGEEQALLFARGSQTGYEGAVSAPTVTAAGSNSGGSLASATYYFKVCAVAGFASTGLGQSVPSTEVNSGAITGPNGSVTITVTSEPTGALYYALYAGTASGAETFQYTFVGNSTVMKTYATGGAAPSGTDSTADANAYDGALTVYADPTKSGYVQRVNAPWSTSNPGVELDTMLNTMYVNNGADPEELWMSGAVRTELNQLMRIGGTGSGTFGAASGYRTTVVAGDDGVTMSTVVTGYLNPNTNRVVDIRVHRYMPSGAVWARTIAVPIQDANVPSAMYAVDVQPYMGVDWPDIQMSYDISTYQVGTVIHAAPAWNGMLLGVQ